MNTIAIENITYTVNNEPPTKEETTTILTKKGINDENLPRKKSNVARVVDQINLVKNTIQRCCQTKGEELVTKLDKILPQDSKSIYNANKYKVKEIAIIYFGLNEIWKTVEQEGKSVRSDNDVQLLFKPFKEAVDRAEDVAVEEKMDGISSAIVCKGPGVDKNRRYLVDGAKATDEKLHRCLVCGHPYVDEPNTNKLVYEENKKLRKQHIAEVRKFMADKQAGKILEGKQKPRAKPATSLILQCHCKEKSCMRGGGNGSCPLCPTGAQGDGPKCACEVCQCQCNVAVDLNKAHVVNALSMEKVDMETLERDSLEQAQLSAVTEAQNLNHHMVQAFELHTHHNAVSGLQPNMDHIQEDAFEAAAKQISKDFTHDSIHQSYLVNYRKSLGKPQTKVIGNYNEILETTKRGGSVPKCQRLNSLNPNLVKQLRKEANAGSTSTNNGDGFDEEEMQQALQLSKEEESNRKVAASEAPNSEYSAFSYGKDGKAVPAGAILNKKPLPVHTVPKTVLGQHSQMSSLPPARRTSSQFGGRISPVPTMGALPCRLVLACVASAALRQKRTLHRLSLILFCLLHELCWSS